MYYNNVHILIYTLIGFIGLIVGRFISWCNVRLPENKKVFSKEFFSKDSDSPESLKYLLMVIIAALYIFTLYTFGIKDTFLKNLELIKYLILIPALVLTFTIDVKHRIIPNRLTLTIFELGIIITFLYGISNINMVKEYIFGSLCGAAIFGIIALLGRLIAGKEAMGLGDLKFMGAIGLFFGINSIVEISLLSFIIAAVFSIIILIIRLIIKKKDEYIAFGPYLAISSLICIFIPNGLVIRSFLNFCQMLSSKIF